MKKFKLLSMVLTLIIISTIFLTGCDAQDKLELLDAIEKSAKMSSWKSDSQIRFTNVTFDTNIEDLLLFQILVPMLDNMSFEIHQKAEQNSEGTKIKLQSDTSIVSSEISEQSSMWASYDFEQQPPTIRQIMKLPQSVVESLPEDLAGKEYMVLDQKDLPSGDQFSPQEYTEMAASMKDFQSTLIELLKDHALNKDPGFIVIKQLKDQVVNGEKMSLYQLKLDNSSFKTILKYALSELSKNEQAKDFIAAFIAFASGFAEGTEGGLDLDQAYDTIANGKAELKNEVDLIMSALKDVTMLGSRGIEMNYLINRDGYIVNQNGVFDFYIDSQEIEDALETLSGDTEYDGKEIYKFTAGIAMEFNIDISSINQDVNIVFPVLTEENSFDFNDFVGIAPSFGRKLYSQVNRAEKFDFSSTSAELVFPVKLGNKTFIPLEPVCKRLGFKLETKKNGDFILSTGKIIIKGKAGATGLMIDDKQKYLPLPVMKIENQIFVPDQFVTQYLSSGVYYDEKTKTLLIQKKE